MKKYIGLVCLLLVIGIFAACPDSQDQIVAATDVVGVANTVGPVNVPITFTQIGGFSTEVCRITGELEFSNTELVGPGEGPILININPALLEVCPFIGSADLGDFGDQQRYAFDFDCMSNPLAYGALIAEIDISTFEETDAGVYPVNLVTATSYRCSDGQPTSVTAALDGLITVQ